MSHASKDVGHVAGSVTIGDTWNVRTGDRPGTLLVCFGDHDQQKPGEKCRWVEFVRASDVAASHEHQIEQAEAGARDMARVAGAYYRELIKGSLEPERASSLTASYILTLIAHNQQQNQRNDPSA